MSYKIRYKLQWTSEVFNDNVSVDIWEKGYTGASSIKRVNSPVLSIADGAAIRCSSLRLAMEAEVEGELKSLYTTDDRKFKVKIKKNNSIIWYGWIIPELYSEAYIPAPYDIDMTAGDGLALLKEEKYNAVNEQETIIGIIKECLISTGIELDFEIYCTIYNQNQDPAIPFILQNKVNKMMFEGKNKWEVLESILLSFNAVLYQQNAKWVIARYADLDRPGKKISWSDLSILGDITRASTTIGEPFVNDAYPVGSLNLEILPAKKDLEVEYLAHRKNSMLINGDCTENKGWALSHEYRVAVPVISTIGYGGGRVKITRDYYVLSPKLRGIHTEDTWISQTLNVSTDTTVYKLSLTYLAMINPVINPGDKEEDQERVTFPIKLINTSADGTKQYISPSGWVTTDSSIQVQVMLPELKYKLGQVDKSCFITSELEFPSIPLTGTLEVRIINPFSISHSTGVISDRYPRQKSCEIYIGKVTLINTRVANGLKSYYMLNESAKTSIDAKSIFFGDAFQESNINLITNNHFTTLEGGVTLDTKWFVNGLECDNFHTMMGYDLSQAEGYSRDSLSGTLVWRAVLSSHILIDTFSNKQLYASKIDYNLLTDEVSGSLLEIPNYSVMPTPGDIVESENSSSNGGTSNEGGNSTSSGGGVTIKIITSSSEEELTDANVLSSIRSVKEIKKGIDERIIKVDDTTEPSDSNFFSALRSIKKFFQKKDIIKSKDETGMTDDKVLSALRSVLEHLSAKDDDTAAGKISFLNGIDVKERALFQNSIRVLEEALFKGPVSSDRFSSGFLGGRGWAILQKEFLNIAGILDSRSEAEFDNLTIRGAMRVFELIISQMSGENGTSITSDMMRVHSIDVENKKIYLDTEGGILYNPFKQGDILMAQQFRGMPTDGNNNISKLYELVVSGVGLGADGEDRLDWITFDKFEGDMSEIAARDVLVRIDSLTNSDRKGIIKQTSVESGAPYIDVIEGLRTDPEDSLKVRLGRLDGIIHHYFGRLSGHGLFSINANLLGAFRLITGEDVLTKFEIMAGLFRSAMQSTMHSLTEEDNFLTNATFTRNMEGWEHLTNIDMYSCGGVLINMGKGLLSGKHNVSEMVECDGRQMLRLKNGYVRQFNDLIKKPEADSIIHFSFRYRCVSAGVLKVGFEGTTVGGAFSVSERPVLPSSEYVTLKVEGIWDGLGDFYLGFTGDIYIELLTFANKPLDDFKVKVSSEFKQTAEAIEARVTKEVFDGLDKYVKEAGWVTTAGGNNLWAKKMLACGNIIASAINQTADKIKIQAKNIALEGLVSVGGNTKLHTDGTIEAKNVKISGVIHATGGVFDGYLKMPFTNLADSDAVPSEGKYYVQEDLNLSTAGVVSHIVLPTAIVHNGSIVSIGNMLFSPVEGEEGLTTTVSVEGGGTICLDSNYDPINGSKNTFVEEVTFMGSIMQFLAVPSRGGDKVQWCVLNNRASGMLASYTVHGGIGALSNCSGIRAEVGGSAAKVGGTGHYQVPHTIGHSNYTASISISGALVFAMVTEKGAYHISIEIFNFMGLYNDAEFDITLFG